MEVDPTVVAQRTLDGDSFMANLEAAELEFARGHPDDFKSLWSHTGDVTLRSGLGGAVELGWERVAALEARVASDDGISPYRRRVAYRA